MKCLWTGGFISDSRRTCRSHILNEKNLDEIHDKNRKHHQQHFWHTLHIRDVSILLPQNALNCCLCNHTTQLSFTNFMIYSKILQIQHLIIWKSWQFGTWLIHRPEGLPFTRKKAISMKHADLRDIFKKASSSVFSSKILVSHNSLSLIPLMSSALKTPENTEVNLDEPKSADKGDIQMECCPD